MNDSPEMPVTAQQPTTCFLIQCDKKFQRPLNLLSEVFRVVLQEAFYIKSAALLFLTTVHVCSTGPIIAQQTSPPVSNQKQTESLTNEDLSGVWSAAATIDPEESIEFSIEENGGILTAIAGSKQIKISQNENGQIRFELDKTKGSFRGWIDDEGQTVTGHWVQPPTPATNYCWATPVQFTQQGERWLGKVTTRADRRRMYLNVYKTENGVRAFFRNPERNSGIYLGPRNVILAEGKLQLLRDDNENPIRGEVIAGVATDRDVHEILIPIQGAEYRFRRLDSSQPSAFHAAVVGAEDYRYRIPKSLDDTWQVAGAAETGLKTDVLESLVREIRATKTDSLGTPYIHSILIARHGKLVFEEYFYDFDGQHLHDTRSAGKSITSMLVGAVMDKHSNLDVDRSLISIFGDEIAEPTSGSFSAELDQRQKWKNELTIGHALNMASGMDIDDDNPDSPGNEGIMQDRTTENDWVEYVLRIPMIRKPGSKSVYGSNNLNLAAAAVARATNSWLPDLFAEHIAKPLSIERYHFNLDPAGNGYMGGGIRLCARDQLKLGQVMLSGGKWNEKRVFDERWVKQSLMGRGSVHEENDYGYGWWLKSLSVQGREVKVFHASGNGGQLIVCIPEFDMVIQFSGGNYGHFPVWYRSLTEIIPNKILPAIDR